MGSPQHLVRLLRLVRTFLRTPLKASVPRDNCLMIAFRPSFGLEHFANGVG